MNRRNGRLIALVLFLAAASALGWGLRNARLVSIDRQSKDLPTRPTETRHMPPTIPDDTTAGDPFPGRITCLYADEKVLYAGGWHTGVYRLSATNAWEPFNEGLSGYRDVRALTSFAGHLFAGTFQGELWEGVGEAWRLSYDFGEGEAAIIRALVPDEQRLLVITGAGLFSWSEAEANPRLLYAGNRVAAIARAGGNESGWLLADWRDGLLRCSPDFQNCQAITGYRGGKFIAGLTVFNKTVYVIAEGSGAFSSADAFTFSPLALGSDLPNLLYADASRLAIAFEDLGLEILPAAPAMRWRKLRFPHPITAIAVYRENIYFGTDGLGVFRETTTGYEAVNQGLLKMDEQTVAEILRSETENHP